MMGVAVTSMAGDGSGKKIAKPGSFSPMMEQQAKDLKLTEAQKAEWQKANQDFSAKRKSYDTDRRKAHAKQRQEYAKVMRKNVEKARKDAQNDRKNQAKMQRDYLQSVRKIMTPEQYTSFLENYWVKGHAMNKNQARPYNMEKGRAVAFRGNPGMQQGMQRGPRSEMRGGKQGMHRGAKGQDSIKVKEAPAEAPVSTPQ